MQQDVRPFSLAPIQQVEPANLPVLLGSDEYIEDRLYKQNLERIESHLWRRERFLIVAHGDCDFEVL